MGKQAQLTEGLAEIFEVSPAEVTPAYEPTWDSLAVVATIALVDDVYGIILNGPDIAKCDRVAKLLDLIMSEGGGA